MASQKELEAMGIINNDIENKNNNKDIYSENTIAKIIKAIAIITGIIGVIFGLYAIDGLNMNGGAIIIIIASVVSAVFVYALGEIIQKLQNIENNTRKSGNIINNDIPKL